MTKRFGRWMMSLALLIGLAGASLPIWLHADTPAGQQVANVDQLKAEAFKALKAGQFDRSSELLTRAAASANDPNLTRMADWTKAFESQRKVFQAERKKQFDKSVGDVHKLIDNKKGDYALDYIAKAYLLAEDKKAFRNEKWIDDVVKTAIEAAKGYEAHEQWLKALRIYSDLGSVEPAVPLWKEKLKTATRRIRLLAMYNPDQFKKIQDAEANEREAVDQIVKPSTQPTTKPSKEKDEDRDDSFKTDWRQSLAGIRTSMLWEALMDARTNYWRDVNYQGLGVGGINSLKLLATTKGLESAFPGLKDAAKKEAFLAKLDEQLKNVKGANATNEQFIVRRAIEKISDSNNETVQLPEEVLVNEFADGAFAELDPFTSMIWPFDVDEFNKTVQGEFSGVGIQIQTDDDGSLRVVSPLEDSPGYRAGIKAGDIITRINGKNAKGISINQAVKNITGKSGTKVVLTIRSHDGSTRDVEIIRQTIKVASVKGWNHRVGGGWDYFIDPESKIGYIRLTNFTKMTSEELDKALAELQQQGVRGLIVDLRYNPGGLLTAATEVCDKFLSDGVIVSTRADRETPNQPTEVRAKKDPDDITNLPLVVLVNQYSASASEIVSGALKDDHRAMIVGERTFGKGSVQMLFPVSRGEGNRPNAYLKLTTSHYYLPSGKCIHREENATEWGVDPDLTVEMTPEQMRGAIDARQELDVLRDAEKKNANDSEKKPDTTGNGTEKTEKEKAKKDPLSQDAQLSAALLVLRLQLAGAQLQ